MWALVEEGLLHALRRHPDVARELPELERRVEAGDLGPGAAAERVLSEFGIEDDD
jgi:LAO/AO transport system kinase